MLNQDHYTKSFYESLTTYLENIATSNANTEEQEEYEQIIEMIIQNKTSTSDVIQAFAKAFPEYPSRRLILLYLMRSIITGSQLSDRSYDYPEFFWIIVESGLFSKLDDVSDVMSALTDICGKDILRSYLIYQLLTLDEGQYSKIMRSLYYVGHTIDSIKIVADKVPFDESNMNAYIVLYADALSLLHTNQASTLDMEDKSYLRNFFERGLQSSSSQIIEYCEKALSRLAVLT